MRNPGIGALILAAGLAVSIAGALRAQQSDFVVIVNAANPTNELTREQVERIFRKQDSTWKGWGDMQIEPVDLNDKSPVREAFTRVIHGKTVSSIEKWWQRVVFSGRGLAPPKRDTDREVINYVRDNKGGIGYISSSVRLADSDGVKVLRVKEE